MGKTYNGVKVIVVFCCYLVFLFLFSTSGSAAITNKQSPRAGAAGDSAEIEKEWGIKILSMRLSAGGYMLDFRYRVIDAEKASPLFSRKIKPKLIDQASGAIFMVPEPPKVGALRQTRAPKADKNYFIIFANPGNYVKKGNKVTVAIGDFKAENILVE